MLCWDLACQVEDMIINAKSPHRQQKRRLGTEKPNSKGHCFGWLHQVSFVGFMSWIAAKLRRLQQAPTSQSRPGSDSGTEWKMSPFQATVREKAQVGFAQLEPFQSKGGGRCRKEGRVAKWRDRSKLRWATSVLYPTCFEPLLRS